MSEITLNGNQRTPLILGICFDSASPLLLPHAHSQICRPLKFIAHSNLLPTQIRPTQIFRPLKFVPLKFVAHFSLHCPLFSSLPTHICHPLFVTHSVLPTHICCPLTFFAHSLLPTLCCPLFVAHSLLPTLCCPLFVAHSLWLNFLMEILTTITALFEPGAPVTMVVPPPPLPVLMAHMDLGPVNPATTILAHEALAQTIHSKCKMPYIAPLNESPGF